MHLPGGEVNRIYPDIEKYVSLLVIGEDNAHKTKAFLVCFTISSAFQRKKKINILQYTHSIKFLQVILICTDKQTILSGGPLCLFYTCLCLDAL